YWQLARRSHLRSIMEATFPSESKAPAEEERKAWSRFLCGADRFTRLAMIQTAGESRQVDPDGLGQHRFIERWISAQKDQDKCRDQTYKAIVGATAALADGKVGL